MRASCAVSRANKIFTCPFQIDQSQSLEVTNSSPSLFCTGTFLLSHTAELLLRKNNALICFFLKEVISTMRHFSVLYKVI